MSHFNHLHVHTATGSLLDSILTVDEMVAFAKKNKQKAIAVTDHGTMTSFVNLVKACKKNDIKPIVGCEIYEVDDMWEKADTKEYSQPRYHLKKKKKNQTGFQNLLKITSMARTEGLYKKPRVDMKYIKENNLGEGIICLTACQAGRLSRYLTAGKNKEAEVRIDLPESLNAKEIYVSEEGNKKVGVIDFGQQTIKIITEGNIVLVNKSKEEPKVKRK